METALQIVPVGVSGDLQTLAGFLHHEQRAVKEEAGAATTAKDSRGEEFQNVRAIICVLGGGETVQAHLRAFQRESGNRGRCPAVLHQCLNLLLHCSDPVQQ